MKKTTKQTIAERGEKELEKAVKAMNKAEPKPLTRAEKIKAAWARKKAEKLKVVIDTAKEEEFAETLKQHWVDGEPLDQTAKADNGKLQLSLVPMDILTAIARVREYGNRKYKCPDNWKNVEPQRYIDATLRHMVAFVNNPKSVDEESGLPHLWHIACNVAFLVSLVK